MVLPDCLCGFLNEVDGRALTGVMVRLQPIDLSGCNQRQCLAAQICSDVTVQVHHLPGLPIQRSAELSENVKPEPLGHDLDVTRDLVSENIIVRFCLVGTVQVSLTDEPTAVYDTLVPGPGFVHSGV